jgi:hypothetical protein
MPLFKPAGLSPMQIEYRKRIRAKPRASCAGACLCLSSQHSGTGTGNTDGIFLLQDIWPSPSSWGWSFGPLQVTFGELICGNGFLKSFPLKMGTSSKMSGYPTSRELTAWFDNKCGLFCQPPSDKPILGLLVLSRPSNKYPSLLCRIDQFSHSE